MTVIVLMYHHTPAGAAQGFYDVPLATLRDQIEALRDAGVSFVKFSECDRRDYVERGMHVALTFDDGHASNEAAFRFLADAGLTPMAFVVRDWSTRDARYLSAAALGDLNGRLSNSAATAPRIGRSTVCPHAELADELAASRDYVGDDRGRRAATMALPGGHGGARELAAAARAGFSLVGNSRPLPHRRLGASVNRICVHRATTRKRRCAGSRPARWRWSLASARFAGDALGAEADGRGSTAR